MTSAKRSERMKARMADPAFKSKAMENLARGRAALAAKRSKKPEAPAPSPARAADPKAASVSPAAAPAPRRAYGIGRWRET